MRNLVIAFVIIVILFGYSVYLNMKPKENKEEKKEVTKETFVTYPQPGDESKQEETNTKIGTVEILTPNIYQQGTHILREDQENFILLESGSVDLNQYLLKKVKVSGSLSPTVEGGKQLMSVETVEPL